MNIKYQHLPKSNLQERQLFPGARARFVHSDHMTLADWHFEAGTPLPEHSHPNEQITSVISGELELMVAGDAILLGPGDSLVIAPDVVHSARAVSACHTIDVFYPVREDYR